MSAQYVCLEWFTQADGSQLCNKTVEVVSTVQADYITPEIMGYVIMYALTVNLLVFGFKSMRRVM